MLLNYSLVILLITVFKLVYNLGSDITKKECNHSIFEFTIRVSVYQINFESLFCFKIRGNASTGYKWLLTTEDKNSSIEFYDLSDIKSTKYYIIDKKPKGYSGMGGFFYFKAKATSVGHIDIQFIHKRPWQDQVLNKKIVTLEVVSPKNNENNIKENL